mmetsp:Transcript_24005/g.80664  ORF Transcript_24005/g.80664 Transcript_24005/m.80664 type:complete len:473 (+) Transcript_24005:995-2413(+)
MGRHVKGVDFKRPEQLLALRRAPDGTRQAEDQVVLAEVVEVVHGRPRLCLVLHLHAVRNVLVLEELVHAVAMAAPRKVLPGVGVVNDDHLLALHHIVAVDGQPRRALAALYPPLELRVGHAVQRRRVGLRAGPRQGVGGAAPDLPRHLVNGGVGRALDHLRDERHQVLVPVLGRMGDHRRAIGAVDEEVVKLIHDGHVVGPREGGVLGARTQPRRLVAPVLAREVPEEGKLKVEVGAVQHARAKVRGRRGRLADVAAGHAKRLEEGPKLGPVAHSEALGGGDHVHLAPAESLERGQHGDNVGLALARAHLRHGAAAGLLGAVAALPGALPALPIVVQKPHRGHLRGVGHDVELPPERRGHARGEASRVATAECGARRVVEAAGGRRQVPGAPEHLQGCIARGLHGLWGRWVDLILEASRVERRLLREAEEAGADCAQQPLGRGLEARAQEVLGGARVAPGHSVEQAGEVRKR